MQTISGEQALAFVRQRHNIGNTSSDFDRIKRQQVFIAGMIRKMLSDNVLLDLGKQRELVQAAADALTVDQNLDLLRLAQQMQSITPDSIEFQTVPFVGTDRDEQDRSIIRLEDEKTLQAFFAELNAEPEPAAEAAAPEVAEVVSPAEVDVEVYNGSGISGLAGSAADELTAAGFQVTGTANADSMDYEVTEIRHATGDEALAAALASQVPGAVTKVVDDAASGTVQLVLGSDFNGVGQAVTAAPPAPVTEVEDTRTAADTGCIN